MKSEIQTFHYENGDLQRVQVVNFEDFGKLRFTRPDYDPQSFVRLCSLFRDFIIKKYAKIFGKIVIFRLPDDENVPFDMEHSTYGKLYDPLVAVNMAFRRSVHSKHRKLVFLDETVKSYFQSLEASGDLVVVEGNRDSVSFLSFGKGMGFLSQVAEQAQLAFNCSFFVMDMFDCATVFDRDGVPLGLALQDGKILNPPQFGREALFVGCDGSVQIRKPDIRQLVVTVDGIDYEHTKGCTFYTRPERRRTPKGKTDIVVVDSRVVALNPKGHSPIPCGGFVIQCENEVPEISDTRVTYKGYDDAIFAVQVGNSAVVDGRPTDRFLSPFYKIWNVFSTAFPPSLYPMDYEHARAPRIVFGADADAKPMVMWFEGAGKFGYEQGKGSCGASLSECAKIAKALGMQNGVHLDGGGSAQILLGAKRSLALSDRRADDFSEVERAIPLGLLWSDSV
ncbi:MAG: phosphodiester glycosidase family protein [Sphaerochaetaceae bacterium]|nr:phosphodiester glycosidase family protein [Sphaerochaetaceae bacterium]